MHQTETTQTNSSWYIDPRVTDLVLDPNEQVVDADAHMLTLPETPLSATAAMMGLTNASNIREIGMYGPSSAASVTETNRDNPNLKLYDGVLFPRDAHIVANILWPWFPALTRTTILTTLQHAGIEDTFWRQEGLKDEQEPWAIPHEVRNPDDPIALRLSQMKDWGWPYFGAIDTTVKSIKAINAVALDQAAGGMGFLDETYQGRDGRDHSVGEALAGQMNWLRTHMDLNPEGLLESIQVNPKHHANKNWTDSPDSFFHADGSWAAHHPEKGWGVAALEVQAEVYDALLGAAEVYGNLASSAVDDHKAFLEAEAADFTARATRLRHIILDKFWVENPAHAGGFFARGTDRDAAGNLRPLAVRTSDMGHLLNSAILDGDDPETVRKREAVVRNLFSQEMLCISGIRTLSSDSPHYWEDRYHDGNSWPWQTYYIARGLERHGYQALAADLKQRVWSVHTATGIFPEYVSGSNDPARRLVRRRVVIRDDRILGDPEHPIGQPAQEIQAWTVAAILALECERGMHPEIAAFSQLAMKPSDADKRALEAELLSRVVPVPIAAQ